MGDLTGKLVFITGAGRGIGAAIARSVAEAGARVVLLDLPGHAGLEAISRELGPQRCHAIAGDLARPEDVPRLWAQGVTWQGHIDVLVNNAGVYEPASIDADFEQWHESWLRTLAVNLVAPAHFCREAIRHFRQRGGGNIINIASRAAFRGDTKDYTNYAASKGGMVALTRTIARGLAAEKILAYVVAPGFVRTELNTDYFRLNGEEAAMREIPLGEMAMPEDIAQVVAFLASGLARHATGTTIDVNGASYVR